MEKKDTIEKKKRKKWEATLKWRRITVNDEIVLQFDIKGYPFFLSEDEEIQLLQALKEINPTAHFIIMSVIE